MNDDSREVKSPARRAFNRAADRRSEPRYEIYLRDIGTGSDVHASVDRKSGFDGSGKH
jgi:hypothetical protein